MVKKLKGGNYTNSNSLAASVSSNSNSTSSSSNSVNSNGGSNTNKYIIIGCLILLLIIIIGVSIYFYKKHNATPTEVPTFAPTSAPTPTPKSKNLGVFHPTKLLADNKNNQVVAVIRGQIKDFGHDYNKLEKEEKRNFKRCFKNPLNTNCSF